MLAPPIPQKYRPIGLTLFGPGLFWQYIFNIRPEDVTYSEPTRVTVHQTLGGAWADDWGRGIREIRFSGHTGWRFVVPGELQMLQLREIIFQHFHDARMNQANAGRDPNWVEMWLEDTVNDIVGTVFPLSLNLKRHKSRPLLYQYELRFLMLRSFLP